MKKLFYGAAVALLIGAASCGKSGDSQSDSKFFSKEATDSLLMAFGETAGYGLNSQITNAMERDSTITKEAFLKGVQYAMAADTTEAYLNGVYLGLQIQTQLKRYKAMGLDVDKKIMLDAFKKAFLVDSMPSQLEMSKADGTFREWSDSLQKAKRNYDIMQLSSSEEAVKNAEDGEKYINAKKAQNDSVKVSASGLGYKIISEGEAKKVDPKGRAMLKYTAKTVDGKVVDQMNGGAMLMSTRTPGLIEGVSMLGKGGKAVLYVPGKLAYGVEAPARMGIGLNELLIYEVEVVDIIEPESANTPK